MIYTLITLPRIEDDIKSHIKSGKKTLASKLLTILAELIEHPRSGRGKPEQLKGYLEREVWSRRIDSKHRLIYEIKDKELIVIAISAYGHYNDK